ncbi:MAG: hypothetical protein KA419_17720 [Acidobacteria bacterium]|nr:hypothetical protein [Acidobacteriota bacterium]
MKLLPKTLKMKLVCGALLAAAVVAALLWRRLSVVPGPVDPWQGAAWRASPPAEGPARPVLWLNNDAVRAGATFAGRTVLAGEMGLLVREPGAADFRRLTVADGLPGGRVEAVAPLGDRLLLGLGMGGLARWDGTRFEALDLPPLREDTVSSLAPTGAGSVLAATRKGFLVDVRPGDYRFVPTPGIPPASYACALPLENGVLVGTFQHGLYRGDGGQFRRILLNQRPFRMVTSLCALGNGEVLAGTDAGLYHLDARGEALGAYFPDRIVEHVNALDGRILCACKEDALYVASLADWLGGRRTFRSVRAPGYVNGSFAGDGIIVLTSAGAYRLTENRGGPGLGRLATPAGELALSSVISLAAGSGGALFLGYFHGGVEERALDGSAPRPLAMPEILHANCLTEKAGTLWIGTPQGLFKRTAAGIAAVGAKESPLLRASVNFVLPFGGPVTAVCHAEGLSILAGRDEYLIYARQGLPSNRVLCAAGTETKLFVGTQAGLAQLGAEKVDRVYQTGTSPLRVNWVTALLNTPRGTVIGTYGGGVQLVTPEGEWAEFTGIGGRLYVNPNALCLAGDRLLVGTLNEGLVALDLDTRKACKCRAVLPSRNVQAVLCAGNALYAATDAGVALFPDYKAILGSE